MLLSRCMKRILTTTTVTSGVSHRLTSSAICNTAARSDSRRCCGVLLPQSSCVDLASSSRSSIIRCGIRSLSIRPLKTLMMGISGYGNYTGFLFQEGNQQHQLPSITTIRIAIRNMGGGPRNEEHKVRLRAIRKARKVYFESLPERPPKPPVCTNHYDDVMKWRTEPISTKIEHRVIHICSFIIYAWLNAYPHGASLRKLQRDIAFRMQRKHRLPGKLPYQAIMPIVGKLERENYLSFRMKSNGHVLIYRDTEKNITPIGQTDMHAMAKKEEEDGEDFARDADKDAADEERFQVRLSPHEVADVEINYDEDMTIINDVDAEVDFDSKEGNETADMFGTDDDDNNNNMEEDPTMLSRPIPDDQIPYERMNFRPKFFKQSKPKVKKEKKKKIRSRSDPVMDEIHLPPDTIRTSRGPRFILPTPAVATRLSQSENAVE